MKLRRVKTIHGEIVDLDIESTENIEIDGGGHLHVLPALIDPHVHFRTPGHEYKEDWRSGAQAAIAGGVTTVFDMPNNSPSCTTIERLAAKRARIDGQLQEVGIPLRYGLYFGAAREDIEELAGAKDDVVGLKIYMGSSTGNLLMDKAAHLERAFEVAAANDVLVAVHAENEAMLKAQQAKYSDAKDAKYHPIIRSREAAVSASAQAIELAAKTGCRLYLVHISTAEELDLVRQARKDGISVYAETTPNHLFLDDEAYGLLGTCAQMNPPIRTRRDQDALWEAVSDGTLDTIGTDHAPHTYAEKTKPYGKAPSGLPGVETMLPLLLDAHNQGRLSLERLVELTRSNVEKIFRVPSNDDVVLVDLEEQRIVSAEAIRSKCAWTPFAGRRLKGWPVMCVLRGTPYRCTHQPPIYSTRKTWEENLRDGPQFTDEVPPRAFPAPEQWIDFLGQRVASRLGVPAGPLLDSRWTTLAGELGFDIVTYKTIRSQAHPCHPLPNVVYVEDDDGTIRQTGAPLDERRLSITNSFGMPSMDTEFLQRDLQKAREGLRPGQMLIVSVVGSHRNTCSFTEDFVNVARFAAQNGAHAVEANFSCPNVATGQGAVYLDPEALRDLSRALVEAIAPLPLIIKVGCFPNDELLRSVLRAADAAGVAAICGINTVSAEIQPPLDVDRPTAGICGAYIRPHGLKFIQAARRCIDEEGLKLTLIGVGGVLTPPDVAAYLEAGAQAVLSATGMMWNPYLALETHEFLKDKDHGRTHHFAASH